MLTVEQVKEHAPVWINMVGNYARRRLWCLKDERSGNPGVAVFQSFRVEIGFTGRKRLITKNELSILSSDKSLAIFTQFINDSIDISIGKVFKDDKAIYDYVHPRTLLPEFLEAKVITKRNLEE